METIEEFYLRHMQLVLLGHSSLDDVEAACLARLEKLAQKKRDEEQARLRNVIGQTQQQATRFLGRFLIAQQRVER